MVVLDTDHMSLLQRGGVEGQRIRRRLRGIPPDDVAITVISYEEQTHGRSKNLLRDYCSIAVLDFDNDAAAEFQRLRATKTRVGTMDLKIAAVVLANNAVLLTRNMSHFEKVPGLHAEDWSV